MSEHHNKIYAKGSAKEVGRYGSLMVTLNIEQLQEYMDSKGFVKVMVFKKRDPDQYGNTHYLTIDRPYN